MADFDDITIVGIVEGEVTEPRNDGTPGSALYCVPLQLSDHPPSEWAELFVQVWDQPPRYTSMHRPGIARVFGDRVLLDGTTLDEIESVHRDTLKVILTETNRLYREWCQKQGQKERQRAEKSEAHKQEVRAKAGRIKFD